MGSVASSGKVVGDSERHYPLVTVVMPIRNEESYIELSLRSVMTQDYPPDRMEILIADGLSVDGTRRKVLELSWQDPRIRILDNPGRIVATGLNLAFQEAKGDILIRVDGHCEVAPDYVSNCVRHILLDGVHAVGGPIETIGETLTAEAIALAMSSRFGVGDSAFRTTTGVTSLVDSVPFPAYTRQAVSQAGPVDERLVRNQDDEYNYRLRKLGFKVLLASDVRSRYYSRSSLSELWRQYFQYGHWKVRVLQKHPAQMSLRQYVPALFVVWLILSSTLGIFSVLGLLAAIAGLCLYLALNVLVSLSLAGRRGWRYLWRLGVAFMCLHFGYGFGFLYGMLVFGKYWFDKSIDQQTYPTDWLQTSKRLTS